MSEVFSLNNSSSRVVQFSVQACADPNALLRVVEFFSVNSILPDLVRSRRFKEGDVVIDVRVRGLDDQKVMVIANKLRSCVLVHGVTVEVLAVGQYREPLQNVA